MRLTDARPKRGSRQKRQRQGRGIAAGQGATCGKGMRGQKSRSGKSTRPGFEGGQLPLYRRLPKLKYFPVVNRKHFTEINVKRLNGLSKQSKVTLGTLLNDGILTTSRGPLKVLGDGELFVPLDVEAAAFSRTAIQKIEAAGGKCKIVEKYESTELIQYSNFSWVQKLREHTEERQHFSSDLLLLLEKYSLHEFDDLSVQQEVGTMVASGMSEGNPQILYQAIASHPCFQDIERAGKITFPERCTVNRECNLEVKLSVTIPTKLNELYEKLGKINISLKKVKLDVLVKAPGFYVEEDLKPFSISPDQQSGKISFRLVPVEEGDKSIDILFFNNAISVGHASVQTNVGIDSKDKHLQKRKH